MVLTAAGRYWVNGVGVRLAGQVIKDRLNRPAHFGFFYMGATRNAERYG